MSSGCLVPCETLKRLVELSEKAREDVERLRVKVAEHAAMLKDATPALHEHEDRLDGHDKTLGALEDGLRSLAFEVISIKKALGSLTDGVDRIFAAVTPLVLSSSRTTDILSNVAKQVDNLHKKLEAADA